jgi:hypothetical protein
MKNKILFFSFLALSLVIGVAAWAAVTSDLLPAADGTYSAFVPKTGTSHYAMVDEAACNGATDYNYTSTVGQRDSYQVSLASIPNGATVNSISIKPCASANKNGSSIMNVFYRYNSANSVDAGNYSLSGTTPTEKIATAFNGLSFIKGSTSTLEIGAVYSSGSKGVRLSRLATVIAYTPLSAPANLMALASSTMVTVLWTDTSSNEAGFIIQRGTDGVNFSQIAVVGADRTYYSDASSKSAGTYYYRVRAYNAGGNSDFSNIASIAVNLDF